MIPPRLVYQLRAAQPADTPQIAALVERCFGAGRYARAAYRLREQAGAAPAYAFVAREAETFRGSVQLWPIAIGAERALLLGPLAVEPAERGRGIGIGLMQAGIAAARRDHWPGIILVGDGPYYARVGFQPLPRGRVAMPGPVDPARLLGLRLDGADITAFQGAARPASGPRADSTRGNPRVAS